jgi:hypothetical protein
MGLIARLRSWALGLPRVLVVDAPGADALRWRVEAELDRRRWPLAVAPADADLLLVVGAPGPQLAAAIDVVWSQVPAPRERVALLDGGDVGAALDDGRAALTNWAAFRADDERPSPGSLLGRDDEQPHEDMDHGGGHEDMDHGGGHEGHHMHHGGEVAGLPMAMTAPDRDGLELDVLNVSLGPVLPGWPTGLVLRGELQGDVLTNAGFSWLDAEPSPDGESADDPQQAALDHLARFLVVAGWPTAARDARRARDGLRSEQPDRREAAQRLAGGVARMVRRSRALRWAASAGRQQAGSGDLVLVGLRHWCDAATGQAVVEEAAPALDDLAGAVDGAEIGTARLIVASAGLRPVAARSAPESAHA